MSWLMLLLGMAIGRLLVIFALDLIDWWNDRQIHKQLTELQKMAETALGGWRNATPLN